VRLRYAYVIRCTHAVKDASGQAVEVHATYDPATGGAQPADGRKVKSTIHWVSAAHVAPAEFRLYDRLFSRDDPEQGETGFLGCLNPNSLNVIHGWVEPQLRDAAVGDRFQFERQGYFAVDPDTTATRPVFNLTVNLRDTWARIARNAA